MLPEEVHRTAFERLLSERPGEFNGLIAEIDGRPAGLAHFLFHRDLWSVRDTCYMVDLFTDPDVRGRGVGRALIEAVYARAESAGIASVYWQTQEVNNRARALYDTLATRTPFVVYEKIL